MVLHPCPMICGSLWPWVVQTGPLKTWADIRWRPFAQLVPQGDLGRPGYGAPPWQAVKMPYLVHHLPKCAAAIRACGPKSGARFSQWVSGHGISIRCTVTVGANFWGWAQTCDRWVVACHTQGVFGCTKWGKTCAPDACSPMDAGWCVLLGGAAAGMSIVYNSVLLVTVERAVVSRSWAVGAAVGVGKKRLGWA